MVIVLEQHQHSKLLGPLLIISLDIPQNVGVSSLVAQQEVTFPRLYRRAVVCWRLLDVLSRFWQQDGNKETLHAVCPKNLPNTKRVCWPICGGEKKRVKQYWSHELLSHLSTVVMRLGKNGLDVTQSVTITSLAIYKQKHF